MAGKNTKKAMSNDTSDNTSDGIDLKRFVEKKRIQNKALKKIIAKLNSDENHTSNK